MKPSKGRIVWYGVDGDYMAAIITDVDEESGYVSLTVFTPSGQLIYDAEFSAVVEDGKWTWPVRDA